MADLEGVCEQHFASEMTLLGIFSIVETFQFALCIIAYFQMRKVQKDNGSMKRATRLALFIFYGCCIIFAVSRIATTITFCFAFEYNDIPWSILFLSYVIHLLSLEFVLFMRLRVVFDTTSESISKKYCYFTYFGWIIRLLMGLAALAMSIMQMGSGPSILGMITLAMLYTLFATQFLAWTFVWKLNKIRKCTTGSANIETDMKLLDTMRKYAVLSVVSVMSTTLYAIMTVIAAPVGQVHAYKIDAVLSVLVCFDVFLHTTCMVLSIVANDGIYRMFCSCFHDRCCGAGYMTKRMELKMMHSVSKSPQSIDTTPNSSKMEELKI